MAPVAERALDASLWIRPVDRQHQLAGMGPSLAFWRVDISGRTSWHSPPRVDGSESPEVFYRLIEAAITRE